MFLKLTPFQYSRQLLSDLAQDSRQATPSTGLVPGLKRGQRIRVIGAHLIVCLRGHPPGRIMKVSESRAGWGPGSDDLEEKLGKL